MRGRRGDGSSVRLGTSRAGGRVLGCGLLTLLLLLLLLLKMGMLEVLMHLKELLLSCR